MPEISRFYGIVIRMYFNDHNPPHFHAIYAEHVAEIDIETLSVFGELKEFIEAYLYLVVKALGEGEKVPFFNRPSRLFSRLGDTSV